MQPEQQTGAKNAIMQAGTANDIRAKGWNLKAEVLNTSVFIIVSHRRGRHMTLTTKVL
jgi:hypothetical protein